MRIPIADDIEALVIKDAGQSFSGEDFRSLLRPCVYMFMRENVPIYIGMSGNGLERVAGRSHHKALNARQECDEVRIYPCVSVDAAYKLERILVGRTQPRYNVNELHHYTNERLGNSLYTRNLKY
jgi:hypothetical protein